MVQASRFLLSLVSIIQDYNSLGSHAKPFYSTFNERTLTFQKKKLVVNLVILNLS